MNPNPTGKRKRASRMLAGRLRKTVPVAAATIVLVLAVTAAATAPLSVDLDSTQRIAVVDDRSQGSYASSSSDRDQLLALAASGNEFQGPQATYSVS